MSTASKFIPDNEVDLIINDIKDSYQDGSMFAWGQDDSDIGLVPFITFYFYTGDGLKGVPADIWQEYIDQGREDELYNESDIEIYEKSQKNTQNLLKNMIQFYREFHQLADLPFLLKRDAPTSEYRKVTNQEDLFKDLNKQVDEAHKQQEDYYIAASSEESINLAPRWSISGIFTHIINMEYSTLKLHFRWSWYLEHQQEWHQFITKWLDILQPEQCYSGFEVSSPLIMDGGPEHGVMERMLADHFYGVDIDHPFTLSFHNNRQPAEWMNPARMGAGLRPATWGIMLSNYWLGRLGKTAQQVKQDLHHICSCTLLSDGVWIETTPKPQLYPVDEGVPEVLVKVNAYLKPILNDQLQLHVFDAWDDDPNPRFDESNSPQWLRRFEVDSNWPSAAIRDADRAQKD